MTPQTETWNKVNRELQISVTKGGRYESPNAALLNCTGVWEGFWVGADVFCKLTAGCITVAVVGALAFLTMVISMGYGLLARDGIPRIEVQRFFWTNLWSNFSSKLQTSEEFGPYSTYHHALWYTECPVSNHSSTCHIYTFFKSASGCRISICSHSSICHLYKIEQSRKQQILNIILWLLPTPRTRGNNSHN